MKIVLLILCCLGIALAGVVKKHEAKSHLPPKHEAKSHLPLKHEAKSEGTVKHEAKAAEVCTGGQADIVFVSDASGSIGSANWELLIQFMKDVVIGLDVGPSLVQLGTVKFANLAEVEFYLNQYSTKLEVLQAIDDIVYTSGGTNTAEGIQLMYEDVFKLSNGDRAQVPDIGIVITDGQSNNQYDTFLQADMAKRQGIQMIAVGIGSGVDMLELRGIASGPEYVLLATDFEALEQIIDAVLNVTCGAMDPVEPDEPGYNCDDKNPCTPQNIAEHKYYWSHTDPRKFVQCDEWGTCYEMPCAPGTVWDPDAYTCIRFSGSGGDNCGTGYDCGPNNPCTPENVEARKFYWPHHEETMFVQCNEWGECFEMPCGAETVWDQTEYTCVHANPPKKTLKKH